MRAVCMHAHKDNHTLCLAVKLRVREDVRACPQLTFGYAMPAIGPRIPQDGCIQYQRPGGSAVVGHDTFTYCTQKLTEYNEHASLVALFVSSHAAGTG